jgi:HD-like signal output (HDOD) protein
MKRVLFVDDEPNVLAGLRRALRGMHGTWELAFADGGAQALELLAASNFDVVVTDIRMPQLDGVRLLEQVRELHPEIIRIIFSGNADQELIRRSVGAAHQFLTKPCDPAELRALLERACLLKERLSEPRVKELVSAVGALPSLPTLYQEVLREISSKSGSLDSVGRLIARDIGMTAKVLQIVNSAFFGVRQQIVDPVEATRFLGLETIKALVLSVQIFAQFKRSRTGLPALPDIWARSMRVSCFARLIARDLELSPAQIDQAFFAGILHDIGVILLVQGLPDEYQQVVARTRPAGALELSAAETLVLGSTHAEVGAYLLGLWGLPGTIVETVAFHHRPSQVQAGLRTPLGCVHVAIALVEAQRAHASEGELAYLDPEFAAASDVARHLPRWRELCAQADQEAA